MPSNIAEGDERSSDKDSVRFFHIAKGSLAELSTQLEIARDVGYFKSTETEAINAKCVELGKNARRTHPRQKRFPALGPPSLSPEPNFMKMELRKTFQFEAAHLLPLLPKTHKCRRLHGHSFNVEIVVAGECDPELGWLMDYADITAPSSPSGKSWITITSTKSPAWKIPPAKSWPCGSGRN